MNSKAIKRQLLAAIAMVLVAAIALGSSTYAWFVASGTVKAEGMKVQAQAEGNLVIRHTTHNWGTVATATLPEANNGIKALKPVSTEDFTTWVHSSAKEPGAHTSDGKYQVVTTTVHPDSDDETAGFSDYALVKQFFIRAATKEAPPKGLYVDKITVTGSATDGKPDHNLSVALRVGIKCTYKTNSETFIFAPVSKGSGNTPAYGPIDTNGTKTGVHMPTNSSAAGTVELKDMTGKEITLAQVGKTNDTVNSPLLDDEVTLPAEKAGGGESSSQDAVEVFVYVWFEGEDTHLYSDNFAAENLDISIEFQSIAPGTTT